MDAPGPPWAMKTKCPKTFQAYSIQNFLTSLEDLIAWGFLSLQI
jgi:hypothetical protein